MAGSSLSGLAAFIRKLRKRYNVPDDEIDRTVQVLAGLYARRKDFDIFLSSKGKVVVVAKKTPSATPEAAGPQADHAAVAGVAGVAVA